MLAQNFKSADELEISEVQHDSLRKVLVLLETGKLKHFQLLEPSLGHDRSFSGDFNMATYGSTHRCGTAACIAGTAELISDAKFIGVKRPVALSELFYASCLQQSTLRHDPLELITPEQAATALRSYLTTGDSRWDMAVA